MTRARRQLHLYVPRSLLPPPEGHDDAHGYGKPSRLLTDKVQSTCDLIRAGDDAYNPGRTGGELRKISVSVDALFR